MVYVHPGRTRRALGWCVAAVALATALCLPGTASAQALYGGVTGQVTDQQGGALPGVTVTATNTGTNSKLEEVTDAQGMYTFRNLPPGTYDIAGALTGFKELRQTGLKVSAGNPVRIDLKLEIGAMSETVNVVSETTLLQTVKADLNTELTVQGRDQPAAERVPELPDAAEPGAGRDAHPVPERRDRHARAARCARG